MNVEPQSAGPAVPVRPWAGTGGLERVCMMVEGVGQLDYGLGKCGKVCEDG